MWNESGPREKATAKAAWGHAQSTDFLLGLLSDVVTGLQASQCATSVHALGDLAFSVTANDTGAARFLTRCLLPAEPSATVTPHLQVFVCVGSAPPYVCPPPWNLPHTDRRHLERLHLTPDGRVSASYDPARGCWMILDMNTRRALLWIAETARLPAWEAAAPFKQILQWSMAGTPLSMLHGGAVGDARHGVLLVGAGGSGKSTTVAACLQEGLGVCGDDLVVIRRSAQGWLAHALYDSIKLIPDAPIAPPPILHGAQWHECGDKRFVRYSDVAAGSPVRTIPLRALLHCRITGGETSRMTSVTPAEMLRAIAPPTVFMLRGREKHLLKEAGILVRDLPCMRLELGNNPAGAAALLRRWLGGYPGE